MKLEDFVAESLKQIIKGVASAQEYGSSVNANINPISARVHSSTEGQAYCSNTNVPLQHVAFDIAVSISEEQVSTDGDNVVGSIAVSASNTTNLQNSSISRIKFEVPILLPTSGERVEW